MPESDRVDALYRWWADHVRDALRAIVDDRPIPLPPEVPT
jgi:hypothetical protein